MNLVSLTKIWGTFRRLSTGNYSEEELEEQLQDRGVVGRKAPLMFRPTRESLPACLNRWEVDARVLLDRSGVTTCASTSGSATVSGRQLPPPRHPTPSRCLVA